jgi:hypothetical protein
MREALDLGRAIRDRDPARLSWGEIVPGRTSTAQGRAGSGGASRARRQPTRRR